MSEKTMELEKKETKPVGKPEVSRRIFVPRVDIYESEDSIVLLADMPGVSEDSVEITLEKDQLSILGSVAETELSEHDRRYREYAVGDFERTFLLSDKINQDEIEATLKNGVLELTLTKAESAKVRKIAVREE